MTQTTFSLRATTASMIALLSLTGCASTDSLFRGTPDQQYQASYQETLTVAAQEREAGNLAASAELYARAATHAPRDTAPLIRLADVYWQMKDPAKSAEALEKARAIDENDVTVLRNLGRAYLGMNELEKAKDAYTAAMAIDPNDSRIVNGLGIAYDLAGDHETAQSHFHSALNMAPNDLDILNNLAFSLIATRNYNDAIKLIEPVYAAGQSTPRLRQNLALAYGLTDREAESRAVAAEDLSPTEIQRNIEVYRTLRTGGAARQDMVAIGRPSFARGGFSTTSTAEAPAQPKASPVTPVVTEAVATPDVVAPVVQTPAAAPEAITAEAVTLSPATPVADKPVDLTAAAPAETVMASTVTGMPVAPVSAPAPTPAPVATPPAATPTVPKPETVVAPAAAPSDMSAPPSTIGFGGPKVYLGLFANESEAREAWVNVWTNNSTLLGSLVASIEPNSGKTALYAVGSGSAQQAKDICSQLRSTGVNCGVTE